MKKSSKKPKKHWTSVNATTNSTNPTLTKKLLKTKDKYGN